MNQQIFITVVSGIQDVASPTIGLAPSSLTATADSDSIVLGWTDNDTYTSIAIMRKSTGDYAVLASAAGDATSYDDTTAVAGTTYTYKVRGVKNGYPTPYSNAGSDVIAVTPHALSSDGTSGNNLTATSPASLAFSNTDTVIFGGWIKSTSHANNCILGKLDSLIDSDYTFGTDGAGKLDFVYWTGAGYAEVTGSVALTNNTKYFVIGWIDSVAQTINIQVNAGTPDSSDYSGIALPFTDSSGDFYLANDGTDALKLRGSIDEVFVCKNPANLASALTLINSTIYNSGSGKLFASLSASDKTTIGLQNWWGLDEASGSRLDLKGGVDLTANGTVAAATALVS